MSHFANNSNDALSLSRRSALVEVLMLAGPTIAQMASYTAMQFIDTFFLSRVSAIDPTAVGVAGMLAFSFISLGFGVLMVVNTLVSQHYGARDLPPCGQYLWQAIWFAIIYSLLLLPILPAAPRIFAFFGHEPSLVKLEAAYFRIVVAGSLFKMLAIAIGQFMLAINRPSSVLLASVCGVTANAVVAWAIILGHLGLPRLGAVGAAWAQNVGMIVEMSVVICVMLRAGIRVPYHVLDWRLCLPKLRTLLVVGIPSGVQVVAEVLAWSLFGAWVIGVFGTTAMAANNYMMRYMILGFMPCFGISTAVTALVGRYIGMGRPDLAERRAHLGFFVAAVYMVACGAFFYIARRPLIGLFTDDPEIIRQGAVLLTFAAGYVVFDAMYIVYNSALRGAGDTFVPAVATGLLCWSIMLGGGFWVAHFFPGLGAAGPWIAGMVYGISLGLFVFFRFHRGGWKLIHLDDPANAATLNKPRTDIVAVEQLATGN